MYPRTGKSRDEKLAERQKAPNTAPSRRSQTPPPTPEQQDTWGLFQWDRYATPWEASPDASAWPHMHSSKSL